MFPYSNSYFGNSLSAIYTAPSNQYTAPIRHFLQPQQDHRRCISKAESDFMAMNRLLWMEHVNWTRMTIISIVFNLPDLPFVQIKEHLLIAAQLVTAANKGDAATAAAKEQEWYRNADDIAIFLSSINPYLTKEAVQQMFYRHLALTKKEAVTMIQKDYQSDVQVFDDIEAEALAMSDMIANAIVMQFCYRFYS